MSGRAELLQRSRQLKRRRKLIQLVVLSVLIVFLFGLIVYTLHRPRWRIEDVRVIGTKSVDGLEVAGLIKKETSKSYFWLVPKNSRLFYPEERLSSLILQTFPRVAVLDLNFTSNKLEVEVVERESEFLWCLVKEETKNCYFTDKEGIAFAEAPTFESHVLFEVRQQVDDIATGTASVLGRSVMPIGQLQSLFDQKDFIISELHKKKAFNRSIITSVELAPGDSYFFNVVSPGFEISQWQLFTSSTMPKDVLVGRLVTLLESGSFARNVISQNKSLAYIDLRLANKVFFKVFENHVEATP